MSNRAIIIQQTTTIKHNGQQYKEVVVSDDYEMGVINLEGYSETFFELPLPQGERILTNYKLIFVYLVS